MSKPWDCLKEPKWKTRIRMGAFTCSNGSDVQWHPTFDDADRPCAEVWIDGNNIAAEGSVTSPIDLREIGEFLIAIADQLEGK